MWQTWEKELTESDWREYCIVQKVLVHLHLVFLGKNLVWCVRQETSFGFSFNSLFISVVVSRVRNISSREGRNERHGETDIPCSFFSPMSWLPRRKKSIIERTAGKDRRERWTFSLSLFTHKTMSVKVDSLVLFSFRSREEKYYKTKTTTSSSPGILFLFSSSPPATSIPFFFFLSWKVSFLKSGLELRSLPSSLSLPLSSPPSSLH